MAIPITKGGKKYVAEGESSVDIVFATDNEYASSENPFPSGYTVFVQGVTIEDTNSWASALTVSEPTTTGFTITFSISPPAYGGYVYWCCIGVKF